MLAARDQENLVYSHQTNAASKPLNQATRGLQPKTPGQRAPKTPFKNLGNDENNPPIFGSQKTGLKALGKGVENRAQPKQKDGKVESEVFVTPLGPRARAPLGVKTTNAKARTFQTPAPLQPTVKPEKTLKKASTARRSVKSKIRIALSEPVETDLLSKERESEVRDIEYCPPTPIELLDPPEDITYDDTFPYLRGNNLCSGYSEVYDIPRDEHGVSIRERKEEQAYARKVQEIEDQMREEMRQPWPREQEDEMVDQMIAAGPKKILQQISNVDTITARSAVSALSSQPQTRLPSVTVRETASSMQKKKASSSTREAKKVSFQPTNPNIMRHNAAVAASKTTLGYSKGRSVSSSLPEKIRSGKIDQSEIHPREFRKLYGEPPMGSKMWDRFRIHGLFDEETEVDEEDLAGHMWRTGIHCDEGVGKEEEEIFQLPMPDGI